MRINNWLLSAACALLANLASAESYVYLTNSTSEPVNISSVQTGDKVLQAGTQWGQYETTIPAYATRKILWMNRDQGISNGKNFYFDTTVTQGNSSVVLQQRLQGKAIGSTIWHAARAMGFADPWYADRDIHNGRTAFAGLQATLSYRSQFTGGYDDLHYVIQTDNRAESQTASNEFKVLAWNIWGVIGAKQICDRWAEIPANVAKFDAVVFSEAFDNSCRDRLRAGLRAEFPYQTPVVDKGNMLEDGGVFIASRWPIAGERKMVYSQCGGTDCLANKGVMMVEIIKHGQAYHIAGTHTQAWNSAEQRALRLSQLASMRQFVDQQRPPATDALFYAGDLNVDRYATPDDYQKMLSMLDVSQPTFVGHGWTFDGVLNSLASGREYLDYVLVSNGHRQPSRSQNEVKIYRSLAPSVWALRDLSDHFAIAGRFSY
ncbi:sphingomyelin phosphodiesterase [Chitinimonas sp. BJB300]|uniref:sphingomyelin phosphodiesterase n=1 Tax=Chitinimonas sp. BJB300 TaxID=1559339 RepID=UPI000C10F4BB|nr:sphingomyelin phosphodiesterase [Chitinimonas sp. BJB300]PHV11050.1 phospholipase [Chitinimonas sp. BJB300]TSJ90078.1 phospholipase [Chitinimonas sp. BJB300]